jgi:hypothetical protein
LLLFEDQRSELDASERHCSAGLLERSEGFIEIDYNFERDFGDILVDSGILCELYDMFLWVSYTKIESRSFEHKALEANDCFSRKIE